MKKLVLAMALVAAMTVGFTTVASAACVCPAPASGPPEDPTTLLPPCGCLAAENSSLCGSITEAGAIGCLQLEGTTVSSMPSGDCAADSNAGCAAGGCAVPDGTVEGETC